MKGDDKRPAFGDSYLHVYGEVCNVGAETAYNARLHVILYQSGEVVAKDTLVTLGNGTLAGESWLALMLTCTILAVP